MNRLDHATLDVLRSDLDDREERIRTIVRETMAELPSGAVVSGQRLCRYIQFPRF